MAKINDFKDFNIRWEGHPKYKTDKIIEDDIVEVIVQKLEMLLYTNKNEVLGSDCFDFGANLEHYLWETQVPNSTLKSSIINQINKYIPELNTIGYEFELTLYDLPVRDAMELNFRIRGYNVSFLFE